MKQLLLRKLYRVVVRLEERLACKITDEENTKLTAKAKQISKYITEGIFGIKK